MKPSHLKTYFRDGTPKASCMLRWACLPWPAREPHAPCHSDLMAWRHVNVTACMAAASNLSRAVCSPAITVPGQGGWSRYRYLIHIGAGQRARLAAHAAGHLLARPHLARVLAGANAASRPVRFAVAVRGRLARKSPALHHPLEPLAYGRACMLSIFQATSIPHITTCSGSLAGLHNSAPVILAQSRHELAFNIPHATQQGRGL